MANLSDATKAPVTITVDDKEWTLAPLELRDFGEIERWLQMLPFVKARWKISALGDAATPEIQKVLINRAETESNKATLQNARALKILSTLEGTGFLLWMSLRKAHPEVTRDEAMRLINADTLEVWQSTLDKISGLAPESSSDKKRPTKKGAA